MGRVGLTELTVLGQLDPVWVILLILVGTVVPALAVTTGQGNTDAHK